ncbi:MAG: hypothetical protein ACYTG0_02935 [Planctomycetota bacterium]|jgi:hypothetical protein
MAKRGRPPVLDDGKRREIVAILSVGCSRRTAARYVGCAVSTIQNTAERDPEFAEKLRRAESAAEINYLQNIRNAAKKEQYWRAAAWALERKNPQDFSARGPDLFTLAQLEEILRRFAGIVVDTLPAAKYRTAVLKRLDALIAESDRAGTEGEA